MERRVRELQVLFLCFWLGLAGIVLSVRADPVVPAESLAKPQTIVVIGPDLPQSRSFFAALLADAADTYHARFVVTADFSQANLDDADYLVALGPGSLDVVRERKMAVPLISAYVPGNLFAAPSERSRHETAVFPVIGLENQFSLARALLPLAKTAGVIVTQASAATMASLRKSALDNGFRLEVSEWNSKGNLIREINLLMQKSDFILAMEDPEIFNPDTARNILLTSYRNGKVVIGPNPAFVRAGSLATIWCTDSDVARAVLDIIRNHASEGKLPSPRQLSCASVLINTQVAKSLSIPVPEHIRAGKLVPEKVKK